MKHTAEPWFHNGKGTVHNGTHSIAVVGGDGLNALNNADRIIESVNVLAGIPDPAAALKAAREALERCEKLISCLTVGQVMDAGWEAISASGLHEYCLNEGRAERSDRISPHFITAALAALKGEQP